MRRRLVGLFVLFVVAGTVGTLIARDPGYVLLAWDDYSLETSIWFAGVLLLLALLVLRILLVFFGLLFGSRYGLRAWLGGRRERAARKRTAAGLQALDAGDFARARKALEGGADDAEAPIVNHIAAARAAQALGDLAARDAQLELALAARPKAAVAVGIARAEMEIEEGEWDAALATLRDLRGKAPRNLRVLRLLRAGLERGGDWQGVLDLLPDLRKAGHLAPEALASIERSARLGALALSATEEPDSAAPVRRVWGATPKALRAEPEFVEAYARACLTAGASAAVEGDIRKALRTHWHLGLVELYGRLTGADAARQLAAAEEWSASHGDDPVLLATLARLCVRDGREERAREYYEASLTHRESAEVCAELGRLCQRQGDADRAATLLDRALVLGAAPVPAALPAPPVAQAS